MIASHKQFTTPILFLNCADRRIARSEVQPVCRYAVVLNNKEVESLSIAVL